MKDEKAIQNFITTWQESSNAGNLCGLLALMTDDAIFLTPGQMPMDKASFRNGFKLMMEHVSLDSNSVIQDLVISGNLAYCWSHLWVAVKPKPSRKLFASRGTH